MNPFNFTEEDIVFLEEKLEKLFDKLKISAHNLTQTQAAIDMLLADPKTDVMKLENLYAREFGFAAENYEVHEKMLTAINQIYLYDDKRFLPRRIEKECKKYLLVEILDR